MVRFESVATDEALAKLEAMLEGQGKEDKEGGGIGVPLPSEEGIC